MKKFYFETTRTARYQLLGNEVNPSKIWIVLHGYGQQVRFFAPKVNELDSGDALIVVPEGLNRYYLKGYNGRVGATWMTKDDREIDISDNNRYLDGLLQKLRSEYPTIQSLNLLAFSQGIATACRWACYTDNNFDRLILWAGSLAHDIDWKQVVDRFSNTQIQYVFGDQDEFFDEAKIAMNQFIFDQVGINYELVTFEGGHIIDPKTLKQILDN